MLKFLLTANLVFITLSSSAQTFWGIDFDNSYYSERIVRDTISNPNCSWQIGRPAKTIFTSANSTPNAIVTDISSPVRANEISIFYLKHSREIFVPYHFFALHFKYQMDGDSTDFGTIEISPDAGHTWVNLMYQDIVFHMNWLSAKPTLNGSTNGWIPFDLAMDEWASANGSGAVFPIYFTADTILFKFTYITDSSSTPHDGWMIDDFQLEDWWEDIPEIQNDNLISISPNPVFDEVRIEKHESAGEGHAQILDCTGKIVFDDAHFTKNSIDTKKLNSGIYFLKFSDSKYFSVERFVVQH